MKSKANQILIKQIEKFGVKKRGRAALLKYLKGERLTRDGSIQAMCYFCQGYYVDNQDKCDDDTCPLLPYHK